MISKDENLGLSYFLYSLLFSENLYILSFTGTFRISLTQEIAKIATRENLPNPGLDMWYLLSFVDFIISSSNLHNVHMRGGYE